MRRRDEPDAREPADQGRSDTDIWHAGSDFHGYELPVLRAG